MTNKFQQLAKQVSEPSTDNSTVIPTTNPVEQANRALNAPNLLLDEEFPQVSEVVSPASSTSTSQLLNGMTPANNDPGILSTQLVSNNNDSFALSNFKNSPRLTPYEDHLKHKELFHEMNLENEILSNKIAELTESLPAGFKELDNKAITKFKKPTKKLTNVSSKRPAFVIKLWEIINDPKNSEYISWMPDGKALQVLNVEKFVKLILPKYYKQSNFASFVRQLNMYGWHKVQDVTAGSMGQTQEVWQFENPNFIKGREDLLDNIVRKKKNDEDETDVHKILDQLEQLKRNQLLITEDLRRVRQDNELLWKESFIARERHKIQLETLDKIMRFLASIYGNNTSNLIEQMNSSNPGDLVQFAGNLPRNNNYGYYNNGNIHNGMNNNITTHQNNSMMVSTQYQQHPQSQVYDYNSKYSENRNNNNRDIGAGAKRQYIQTPSQYSAESVTQYSGPRPHLMITNERNSTSTPSSNKSPNELRMKTAGFEASSSDNLDSSIREIHRGPENRNSDTKRYIQHIPDYVDTPRHFSDFSGPTSIQQHGRTNQSIPPTQTLSANSLSSTRLETYDNGSSSYDVSSYNTSSSNSKAPTINNYPSSQLHNNEMAQIRSIPLKETSVVANIADKPGPLPNPVKTSEIMGNINSQLHKNQSALKQVNDWISKYNENLDGDIPPMDDFQVDDFLQQPLDMSVGATPIDMTNVEQFMTADTPVVTPMMSMNDDDLYLNKKRNSSNELLAINNDPSDITLGQPAKKFKPA